MSTRKYNEFLDIGGSSDDEANDRGYDSEAAEESKIGNAKRRRTKQTHDLLGDDESDGSENEASEDEDEKLSAAKTKGKGKKKTTTKTPTTKKRGDGDDDDEEENEEDDLGDQYLELADDDETSTKASKSKKPSTDKTKPEKKEKKKKKPGVVYLSSLPPYMKPFALKSLFETRGFGPITKVFLSPEVRPASAPRRRSNKRKTYSDGWVEFASKKTAKICAETMNASIIGGRKGSWYHDDILNVKYLTGLRWDDLVDQIQRERKEREARQRIEDARTRKEDQVFLEGVEQGKVLDGMQKKNEDKKKRMLQQADEGVESEKSRGEDAKIRRLFKQNEVKLGRDKIQNNVPLEEDAKKVLGQIF
ncbi:RNA-binding ATPase activator ESF2 [Aspergillus melleus]|uniref:RNA-binding ATPase activator ESF2 n=1 Tax=Aspergillus melleus TaxID=138277 RepID=UPI001E8CA74A|nr:RNA-binding ATPase activator esf2 [Aspergillus melleus]KAH8429449.1 RNA-binding ATPase activator esf2 [Aspergillus melleus]